MTKRAKEELIAAQREARAKDDGCKRMQAAVDRITQEGLDAIAKDFGTEPTSLDEMRKRPILTVSGGRLSEEAARKIAEVFEGHRRGEYHRMVIV